MVHGVEGNGEKVSFGSAESLHDREAQSRLSDPLVRVKKRILREITRKLIRDRTLKCYGKKRKKRYRSIVFDVR